MEPRIAHGMPTLAERSLGAISTPFGGVRGSHRSRLFFAVMRASSEPSYLAEHLGLRPPLVSKCLGELESSEVVRRVRRGRAVFYTVGSAVSLGVHGKLLRVSIRSGPAVLLTLISEAEGAALGVSAIHAALRSNGCCTAKSARLDDEGPAPTPGVPKASRLPTAPGRW